jgi:hypothetical protein
MQPGALDWAKVLEYGLGVAALLWIGVYVVMPLRDRHMKFLDSVEETNDKLAGTIDKQADILHGLQNGLTQLANNQKETSEEVKKLADIVEKMSSIQQHLRMP